MARRKNESDEGGREQHLYNSNVPIVAAEDSRERIGMVDAKALGSTYEEEAQLAIATRYQGREAAIPTARQLWSWLKVMKLRVGVAMACIYMSQKPSRDKYDCEEYCMRFRQAR